MTKLGGKTGGNAVILMKMKSGVFPGKNGRTNRGCRIRNRQTILFTPDRRRVKIKKFKKFCVVC